MVKNKFHKSQKNSNIFLLIVRWETVKCYLQFACTVMEENDQSIFCWNKTQNILSPTFLRKNNKPGVGPKMHEKLAYKNTYMNEWIGIKIIKNKSSPGMHCMPFSLQIWSPFNICGGMFFLIVLLFRKPVWIATKSLILIWCLVH